MSGNVSGNSDYERYSLTRWGKEVGHSDIKESTGEVDISNIRENSIFRELGIDKNEDGMLDQGELLYLQKLLEKIDEYYIDNNKINRFDTRKANRAAKELDGPSGVKRLGLKKRKQFFAALQQLGIIVDDKNNFEYINALAGNKTTPKITRVRLDEKKKTITVTYDDGSSSEQSLNGKKYTYTAANNKVYVITQQNKGKKIEEQTASGGSTAATGNNVIVDSKGNITITKVEKANDTVTTIVEKKDKNNKQIEKTTTIENSNGTVTETTEKGSKKIVVKKDKQGNIQETEETVVQGNTTTITKKNGQGKITEEEKTETTKDGTTVTTKKGNKTTVVKKDTQD